MWAKLGQMFVTYLILPLAEKGIAAIVKWFNEERAINKAAKKAEIKVKAYKDAKTKKDSDSSFSDLP